MDLRIAASFAVEMADPVRCDAPAGASALLGVSDSPLHTHNAIRGSVSIHVPLIKDRAQEVPVNADAST